MKTLAVCNQKGGVGKTATTAQLARAAVRQGLRVLVVDADPQGNATSALAAEELPRDAAGLADVLSSRTDTTVADVIVPGVWPGLEVLPTVGGGSLGLVRDELIQTAIGREGRLRDALAAAGEAWDLVLIDCAPSLDQLTINALAATDIAAAVTEADRFASHGLVQLIETIGLVRQHYRPSLRLTGVIVNRYRPREREARTWLEELRGASEAMGFPLLDPPVPYRAGIAAAMAAGAGIDEWTAMPRAQRDELADLYTAHLHTITQEA